MVPEDEERWDLVIPDWLAPDDAEVPFGFRSFDKVSGEPVPDNAAFDAHGRVIAVPFGDQVFNSSVSPLLKNTIIRTTSPDPGILAGNPACLRE